MNFLVKARGGGLLSASTDDDMIAWYENDGVQSFTERIITTLAHGDSYCQNSGGKGKCSSVYAIDVDGDGDVDPLSASWADDTIAWYENDGTRTTERNLSRGTSS